MTNAAQEPAPFDKRKRVRKNKWRVHVNNEDGTHYNEEFSNWTVLHHYVQEAVGFSHVDGISITEIRDEG